MSNRHALVLGLLLAATAGCGGASNGTGSSSSALTCDSYCQTITSSCAGQNAQYQDYGGYTAASNCTSACGQTAAFGLAKGTSGDTSGNTLACRIHWAEVAAGDPTSCAKAGTSGGGVCGSWCDNYCALAMKNCTAANGNALYPSLDACQAACAAMPAAGGANDYSGDTVQCRINYAASAFWSPAQNCPNAAAQSQACAPRAW